VSYRWNFWVLFHVICGAMLLKHNMLPTVSREMRDCPSSCLIQILRRLEMGLKIWWNKGSFLGWQKEGRTRTAKSSSLRLLPDLDLITNYFTQPDSSLFPITPSAPSPCIVPRKTDLERQYTSRNWLTIELFVARFYRQSEPRVCDYFHLPQNTQ
jgi:hypothetical protein